MAEPEQNEPQGKRPEDFTPEEILQLTKDAQPLLKAFIEIYTKEILGPEQVEIYNSKGMPGALGEIINQAIPPQLFHAAPYRFVDLAQRAVLFGYSLSEIKRRAALMVGNEENPVDLFESLDKLWDEGEQENDTK